MATKKANLKKSSKTAHKKVTEEISKVEKTVKAIVKNDKKTDTIFLEEISKPSLVLLFYFLVIQALESNLLNL